MLFVSAVLICLLAIPPAAAQSQAAGATSAHRQPQPPDEPGSALSLIYNAGFLLPGYCPSPAESSTLIPPAPPGAGSQAACKELLAYAVLGLSGAVVCAAVGVENLQQDDIRGWQLGWEYASPGAYRTLDPAGAVLVSGSSGGCCSCRRPANKPVGGGCQAAG